MEHVEQRDAARLALRGFLEKIIIPPGEALLQVVGNAGVMLPAAQGRTIHQPAVLELVLDGCGGPQPPVLAALLDGRVTSLADEGRLDGYGAT